jgi:hypothetical protein
MIASMRPVSPAAAAVFVAAAIGLTFIATRSTQIAPLQPAQHRVVQSPQRIGLIDTIVLPDSSKVYVLRVPSGEYLGTTCLLPVTESGQQQRLTCLGSSFSDAPAE